MRVIATRLGFFAGARRRPGEEFHLPESALKNGNLPSWVVPATDAEREKIGNAKLLEAKRGKEAAIAAAGPKRAQRGFASAPGAEDLV